MINQEKGKEEVREYKGKGRVLSVRVGTEGNMLLKSCLWTTGWRNKAGIYQTKSVGNVCWS